MKYVYPARVIAENGGYTIDFPDVEGAITQGENLFEALTNAESALAEILIAREDNVEMSNKIIEPTIGDTLIKVDTDEYRKNPSDKIELWFNPANKKYFTVMSEDIEVMPTIGKYLAEIAGVS